MDKRQSYKTLKEGYSVLSRKIFEDDLELNIENLDYMLEEVSKRLEPLLEKYKDSMSLLMLRDFYNVFLDKHMNQIYHLNSVNDEIGRLNVTLFDEKRKINAGIRKSLTDVITDYNCAPLEMAKRRFIRNYNTNREEVIEKDMQTILDTNDFFLTITNPNSHFPNLEFDNDNDSWMEKEQGIKRRLAEIEFYLLTSYDFEYEEDIEEMKRLIRLTRFLESGKKLYEILSSDLEGIALMTEVNNEINVTEILGKYSLR